MKSRTNKTITCLTLLSLFISLFPLRNLAITAATADSWGYISPAESTAGFASYEYTTDTMTYNVTDGWAGRMIYNDIADLSGKDYAVEFDTNLAGGALLISPNYEDAAHFSGVALDFGAQTLDGIVVNGTVLDDFSFREQINTGTHTPVVSASHSYTPSGGRIRVEYRNGSGGTLAGGSATVYEKFTGDADFTLIGSYIFGNNVADTAGTANRLVIQLWLGSGTIGNFSFEDITAPAWTHINATEAGTGLASYNKSTDTMTFGVTDGWAARMVYNKTADFSGKDYAVEFDANLTGGALLISPNYEDATHFSGVALDFGAQTLDGVVVNDTVLDDFSFREQINTGTHTPVIPASHSYTPAGGRIRVEYRNGSGGTLAGGSATVYEKFIGDADFTLIGAYPFGNSIADTINTANRFVIQLWLGSGSISNISFEDITSWTNINETESKTGLASYAIASDTITFGQTDGWAARMIYNDTMDLSGKNYAVEFDASLAGGALLISPNYEDATHFSGVALDFGAQTLDGIVVNNTVVDDFSFREMINTGTFTPVVQASHSYTPSGGRLRIEFRNGSGGTLAGGSATVYEKFAGDTEFTLIGTYLFGNNLADTAGTANRLVIQLWLGSGSISNITLNEIQDQPAPTPTWKHLSDAEKAVNDASYDSDTGIITFSGAQGWSSRLINTVIGDVSTQNFAVEFDSDLGSGGAIGVTPFFEDGLNFYSVYFDIGGLRLDGVGIMGTTNGSLNVVDDFAYINNSLYPCFPLNDYASTKGSNVRIRVEFFTGDSGTMSGGTAYYYYKVHGTDTWHRIGAFLMPDTIVDHAGIPNKVLIHGRLVNGTVSDISVIQNITGPIVNPAVVDSAKWGYCTKYDKTVRTASYSDATDTMTLKADGASLWDTRLMSLTVNDTAGKCFSLEFDADLKPGGAIGVIPFYESESNWYGVYFDRGAAAIDGVGYKNGAIFDDFSYVNSTLFSSKSAESYPFFGKFRYRFEYFCNSSGGASGAVCRIYYRENAGSSAGDTRWRYIGDYTIPKGLEDNAAVANKLVIHARLLTGTLTNIKYTEISADTKTEYLAAGNDVEYEDGFPSDSYTPAIISGNTSRDTSGNITSETASENAGTESQSSSSSQDAHQDTTQKVITRSQKSRSIKMRRFGASC